MKNALKSLGFLTVLGTLIFISSCGSDDGGGIIIDDDGGGSFTVANGLYIAGISSSDTTIVNAYALNEAFVEGDGFSQLERDGHYAGYIYLDAGSYVFAEVDDQDVTAVFGGTTTVIDTIDSNPDAGPDLFTVVDLEADGAQIDISKSAVYHIIYDQLESEAIIIEVERWGILGNAPYKTVCEGVGFSTNEDIDAEIVTSSADGTTWQAENVIMREGGFKIRHSDAWKIETREGNDGAADPFAPEFGYVAFTNFGASSIDDPLSEGGGAIPIGADEEGLYTVTIELDNSGTVSVSIEQTGAAEECAFDPDLFEWGIIGSGSQGTVDTDGWNDHKELFYAGESDGTHTWRGIFPVDDTPENNEFKFRADDGWNTKLTPGTDTAPVTVTVLSEGIVDNTDVTPGDASWFADNIPGGFIYVVITTSDLGDSWTITLDEASIGVVGTGSPAGAWPDEMNPSPDVAMTYNDDLASLSITGDFTTDTWKIRVNESWDLNLGGTLDGSTALNFNGFGDDFTLSSADNYTVTITTDDGGVTYTGEAEITAARQ